MDYILWGMLSRTVIRHSTPPSTPAPMGRSLFSRLITFFLCTLLVISPPSLAKVAVNLSVESRYEENIARVASPTTALSDQILQTKIGVGSLWIRGNHSGFNLSASASYLDHLRYGGLDHLLFETSLRWRFKPDLAFSAPWYGVRFSLSHHNYPGSELRDGNGYDLEASGGKRLSDRILIRVGVGHSRFVPNDGAGVERSWLGSTQSSSVFKTETSRIFAGLDYRLWKATLYSQLTYQRGDLLSAMGYASPSVWGNPVTLSGLEQTLGHSQAYFADDALPLVIYRLDGSAHIADVGFNYPVNRYLALDLMLRVVESSAENDMDYSNRSAHLGLFYRWK
ncbi:MAG: hypothetical protein HQL48_00070 [Gammaproteobacteria bacterium]|nr:hypothetical protein [Gammaproteobacteria bacterium]